MALLRKLFWVAIFLISTLSFIVLFEHGTHDFVPHLQKQIEELSKAAKDQISPPKADKAP